MIEHNGRMYARVSSVIKPYSDYDFDSCPFSKRKAIIGTDVHQAISDDIMEDFPSPSVEGLPYFESYEAWKEVLNPIFINSEERYFDDTLRITGQVDCIIRIGSEILLVDFKTSTSESPTWEMQAHLYHYLITASGKPISDRMLFVKLSPYGKIPQVFCYQFSSNILAKCKTAVEEFWKNVQK